MIEAVTRDHLDATNRKLNSKIGLLLRAEYCEFMAESTTGHASRMWRISADRRKQEAEAYVAT